MKTYLLPEDVRNAVLQFLYDQPYKVVARGVAMLEGLAVAPEASQGEAQAGTVINLAPPTASELVVRPTEPEK